MKKLLSVILIFSLIFTLSNVAFAANKENMERPTIKLYISNADKEMQFIKKINKAEGKKYSKEDNSILLYITDKQELGDSVILSGNGIAKEDGKEYSFTFTNEKLIIEEIRNKRLYDGTIEMKMGSDSKQYDGLLDITTTNNYNKTIASLTIKDPVNDSQTVMLYGDTFPEQRELVQNRAKQLLLEEKNALDAEELDTKEIEKEKFFAAGSGTIYKHVSNKSNSEIGGSVKSKQMMVMSIAKYDPKMAGTLTGSEVIRVFSRSYNVTANVPNAVASQAYSASVGFLSNGGFLNTTAIKPNKSQLSLPTGLQIMMLAADDSKWVTKTINFILGKLASNSTNIGGGSANATGVVYNLSNWTAMNLPSSTTSSDAESNTTNGIGFEIRYDSFGTGGSSASATCSASVKYRIVLDSDRTTTLSTGTAVYTHTLYNL